MSLSRCLNTGIKIPAIHVSHRISSTNSTPKKWFIIKQTPQRVLTKFEYTSVHTKQYGDVYASLLDLQAQLLRHVTDHLTPRMPFLRSIANAIARIDVLLAWASVSDECHFIRPQLSPDYRIQITVRTCGRHPLQELVAERFIPNSVTMTPETPSIVILTGPNSSGKSVLLKQIGTQNPPNFTQLSSCT